MKCKNCGKQNPRGFRYCGYCQHELSSNEKPPASPKFLILGLVFLCAVAVLVVTLVLRSSEPETVKDQACLHEWPETANGEIIACIKCGAVRFTTNEERQETGNNVSAEELASALDGMESFVENGKFLFTPAEFMSRMEQIGSQHYEHFSCDLISDENILFGTVSYGDGLEAVVDFYTSEYKQIQYNALNERNVYTLGMLCEDDTNSCAEIFLMACDPKMNSYSGYLFNELYEKRNYSEMVCNSLGNPIRDTGLSTAWYHEIGYTLRFLDSGNNKRNMLITVSPSDGHPALVGNTFGEVFGYKEAEPERVLTKQWDDGSIKICFLNERELYFELTDEYLNQYPLVDNPVELAAVTFSLNKKDMEGILASFAVSDIVLREAGFMDAKGYVNRDMKFADMLFENVNGCLTMYLALPEDLPWNLYDIHEITVYTHMDEKQSKKHVVEMPKTVTEIQANWEDGIYDEKLDDFVTKGTFVALNSEGKVVWKHSPPARANMGQFGALNEIGFINDHFYYFDNGSIVALDAQTGKQLWRNSDFDACLGPWDVNAEGVLILSGIHEPDLFIINEKGKLLKRIEGISEEYPYVTKVYAKNDHVVVSVNSYWEGGVCRFFVDLKDYMHTPL